VRDVFLAFAAPAEVRRVVFGAPDDQVRVCAGFDDRPEYQECRVFRIAVLWGICVPEFLKFDADLIVEIYATGRRRLAGRPAALRHNVRSNRRRHRCAIRSCGFGDLRWRRRTIVDDLVTRSVP